WPYNGNDFTDFKNKKRGKYAFLIPIIGGSVLIGIIILISVIAFTNKN
nr:putative membrane protein [Emiliania huxleyi virus 86]